VLSTSGTSGVDTTVTNGTLYYYVVTGSNAIGESGSSSQIGVLPGSLPSPWLTMNIGSMGGAIGGANLSGTTYKVAASGTDIWGTADNFRYVYQSSGTSGTITARVAALGNTNTAAKAGVMIRETLTPGSNYAGVYITPSSGAKAEYRSTTGSAAVSLKTTSRIVAPYWVRVVRTGSTFTFYISSNGSNWTSMGSTTITMANSVYIGLPACSHSSGVLTTGSFDNVTVSP
jgi:regulation of enolase protein 1 (concanavalin A-like superfamily)